jgi:hypothetical protein
MGLMAVTGQSRWCRFDIENREAVPLQVSDDVLREA